MTREDALKQLAGTWHFSEVGGLISVREVELISALGEHEAAHNRKPEIFMPAPPVDKWTAH